MVNSLLFKWEDSQALKHHCGFCERPLSHPGARSSCFGKHSEPCVRFHQAMFMRLRGHTCAPCLSINEVHYRRHHDIAEQLRAVYEICGEITWGIIPSDNDSRERAKECGDVPEADENQDPNYDYGDTPTSKREKKEAKRLARAASRSKVITQYEITYIDRIMHSSHGLPSNDSDVPCNAEEVEEIERQLRYHAHVYNTQADRKGLRKLSEASVDTSIDFEAEICRIFEAFRISDLLKRNTKTRGLQGKDLKTFLALVEGIKQALVEDIIQVNKDAAEVRMRRAGYLRYTNKASYEIIEERYTEKDWKTGGKCVPDASESSGTTSPVDEFEAAASEEQESQLPQRPRDPHGPDRRHLESTHTRVNGEDGLYEYTIEPYRTPLLPLPPDPTPGKKTTSMRVLSIKTTGHDKASEKAAENRNKGYPRLASHGWQKVTHGAIPTNVVARPRIRGNLPSQQLADRTQPILTKAPSNCSETSPLRSDTWNSSNGTNTKALRVQPPSVWTAQEPEGFVVASKETVNDQPAISQKKKAKKTRETKRKAKKLEVLDCIPDIASFRAEAAEEVTDNTDTISTDKTTLEAECGLSEMIRSEKISSHLNGIDADSDIDQVEKAAAQPPVPSEKTIPVFKPATKPSTKHEKHMHWLRFTRYLLVDQLNDPIPSSYSGCSHATSCVFENNEIQDCPFHEPFCGCADPMRDQCYLVLPSEQLYSTGPYNRIRGEKLMALYEANDRTKGRLMLVDDDMVDYLMEVSMDSLNHHDPAFMPPRLAREYLDGVDMRIPTPLIQQESQFQKLLVRNRIIKEELTEELLRDIQCGMFERAGKQHMCYCQDEMPEQMPTAKNIVVCSYKDCFIQYFHKSCVENLGVEKVSRWYCTDCVYEMRAVAHDALHKLVSSNVTDEDVDEKPARLGLTKAQEALEKKIDDLLQLPREDFIQQMRAVMNTFMVQFGDLESTPDEVQKRIVDKLKQVGVLAEDALNATGAVL